MVEKVTNASSTCCGSFSGMLSSSANLRKDLSKVAYLTAMGAPIAFVSKNVLRPESFTATRGP